MSPVGPFATPTGRERDANVYSKIVRADLPTGYWRLEEDLAEITANQDSRDFEGSIGTWVANSGMSSVTRSTDTAHSGSASGKAVANADSNQGAYHGAVIVCGPHQSFTFSLWLYGNNNADPISLLAYFYQDGGFVGSAGTALGVVPQSWTKYTWTFTNPEPSWNGFRPAIHFTNGNAAVGQALYFDDVSVKRGPGKHGDNGSSGKEMEWTTGTPTFGVEGKYGNCITTPGGTVATAPAASDFAYSTGSIECWVKAAAPGASYRGLVVKQEAYGVFLKDGVVNAYNWTAGDQSSGVNVADGLWHHVAYTFQPGAAALYVDGVKSTFAAHAVSAQNQRLCLTNGFDTGNGQELIGSLDEVAVYNYRLSDAQVAAHLAVG